MEKMSPRLDSIHVGITYASGHLYFDKCGQTLVDIENECEGWLTTSATPHTGVVENPDKLFNLNFSNSKFNFHALKAHNINIQEIAKEIAVLWKIVQANLGLDEFLRIGCRLHYLLATDSIDNADKLVRKAEYNVRFPNSLSSVGYKVKTQRLIVVFQNDDFEYRVEFGSVTRNEAINPESLQKGDPRLLSKKQDQFRIAQLKRFKEYVADPMYAVNLDVDCAQIKPESNLVEEFMLKQSENIKNDFLPLLENLS